jgi:hypothetical protein
VPRALTAGLAAVLLALHGWAELSAAPSSLTLVPPVRAAAGSFLGVGLTLPADDRGLKVTNTVATDVDHDGDVDAVALTRRGRILVWINSGDGRLVRLVPEQKRPKRTRVAGPASALVATFAAGAPDRLDGQLGTRSEAPPARNFRKAHTQPSAVSVQRHLKTSATRGPPALTTRLVL